MTLKDYINKEQLTDEEEKQLIDKLSDLSEADSLNTFFDAYLEDVPSYIKEIIEKEGLNDTNIAMAISENYNEYSNPDLNEFGDCIDTPQTKRCIEKQNFWYLKALELDEYSCTLDEIWAEDESGYRRFESIYLNYYSHTELEKKAFGDLYNSWGCRYALGLGGVGLYDREDINYRYARQLFEKAKNDDSKISLYYIYANGLGVKKNLKKANSFIKNLPANTPLYAFKSNVSEGIKIEKIEEDNNQEQPKKEKKQRKPRKKNKVKSFFKKILSLFK